MEPTNTHTQAQKMLTGLALAQNAFMAFYTKADFKLLSDSETCQVREIYYRFKSLDESLNLRAFSNGKEVSNGSY